MRETKEFIAHGFRIEIVEKPAFDAVGYTAFVRLDGVSIARFLKELAENGKMERLAATSSAPQQIWVCLSGNEGRPDADCRCTVCLERTPGQDFSALAEGELFSLHAPASAWAVFEVNAGQTPTELHDVGVYNMAEEIGYAFNDEVGFHLDNEHEWRPGKPMLFWLPVKKAT